jgi:hypothetical protein
MKDNENMAVDEKLARYYYETVKAPRLVTELQQLRRTTEP